MKELSSCQGMGECGERSLYKDWKCAGTKVYIMWN